MRIFLALLAAAGLGSRPPRQSSRRSRSPFSTAPCAAAAGGRFVWVSEYGSPYLVRINPKTNKVCPERRSASARAGSATARGRCGSRTRARSTVSRVSVTTGKRLKAIPVGSTPYDATFASGAAWTTAYGAGELERIDPARNRVVARWPLRAGDGGRRRVRLGLGGRRRRGDPGRSRLQQAARDDPRERRCRLDGGICGRRVGDDSRRGSPASIRRRTPSPPRCRSRARRRSATRTSSAARSGCLRSAGTRSP